MIRYYVHTRTQDPNSPVSQQAAEAEVDRYYYRNNCSVEDTKTSILEALGVSKDTNQQDWISMDMAIEKNSSEQMNDNIPNSNESNKTIDSKGIKLSKIVRSGEGPAHCHEQWTTVVVPDWAIGQAFFFQVTNNSPLNLSCELFLDGEKVCHNAPIEPNSTRTIRPDNNRYYERHQWILNPAKRIKLTTGTANSVAPKPPPTPRYNGIRPNYDGQRISQELYPDATTFGWTFTGSVEESRVEFYEKRLNMGIVKLDFYYTTGTIKTVLQHPTSGRNQLFRAQVSPEQYTAILMNPRAHTGQGYRRREDRPTGSNAAANQENDEDEFDQQPQPEVVNEEEMRDADGTAASGSTYFARNDNYDFKKQGHLNRVNQMNQLQQSNDYSQWRDANKKEYAVVHARFYISVPKRRYYAPPPNTARGGRGGHNHQRRGKPREKLQLPEQSTVIDVKAAERATLGTKYKSIGPAQSFSRSRVRMERINGLTDDKHAKGNPLFESKLYYRAEDVINGVKNDSDDDMSDGEEQEAVQPPSLAEYKASKIEQVKQYHTELNMCIEDQDDAAQLLLNTKNKISLSESIADVDESVKMFFTDLTKRQIS